MDSKGIVYGSMGVDWGLGPCFSVLVLQFPNGRRFRVAESSKNVRGTGERTVQCSRVVCVDDAWSRFWPGGTEKPGQKVGFCLIVIEYWMGECTGSQVVTDGVDLWRLCRGEGDKAEHMYPERGGLCSLPDWWDRKWEELSLRAIGNFLGVG